MSTSTIVPATLVALSAVATASAGIEYELFIIEPWNQSYALATSGVSGINNLNQVSGCASTDPLGNPCSFLWTVDSGKQPINLAGQINDNGVIAAINTIRWPDGTLQEIDGALHGVGAINNANVIAGSSGGVGICPSGSTGGSSEAAVWDPVNGSRLLEPLFGIPAADEAWAINESNQVVGVRTSTGQCGHHKAFHLDLETGVYTDLHFLLTGSSSSGITEPYDINDNGVVVGEGPFGDTVRPFLWSADAGFTFPPAAPDSILDFTHLYSINNHGQAVGGAIVDPDGDWEWHAIIYDEQNGMRDLNELIELPANFVVDTAEMINENGWIIGRGHSGTWSPERAVVLVPLATQTEPAADVNGDGFVGVDDLIAVIVSWGACPNPPATCPADITGDKRVDVDDLVEVILGWT